MCAINEGEMLDIDKERTRQRRGDVRYRSETWGEADLGKWYDRDSERNEKLRNVEW